MELGNAPDPIRVLVVSPLPEIAAPVAALLKAFGASPLCMANAEDAVRVLRDHRVDVIVVDHVLPGITGAEFISRLRMSRRSDLRSLPIIGVAGRLGTEREMMAAGATCFVQKNARSLGLVKACRWVLEVYGRAPASRERTPSQDTTPPP
jgi:CheY-like chemotaxis protein